MQSARSSRPRRTGPSHLRVVPKARAVDASPTWIEITLSWGTTPLHVQHLREPGRYVLADTLEDGESGFIVAGRAGEASRLPILIERDGEMFARIPDLAMGAGTANLTLVVEGLVLVRRDAQRMLERDRVTPDAFLFRLERGRRCRFEARGLEVQIEAVAGETAPPHLRPRLTRSDWIVLAISAALHLAAIVAIVLNSPILP